MCLIGPYISRHPRSRSGSLWWCWLEPISASSLIDILSTNGVLFLGSPAYTNVLRMLLRSQSQSYILAHRVAGWLKFDYQLEVRKHLVVG